MESYVGQIVKEKKCSWRWYFKWNLNEVKAAGKHCVWRCNDLVFQDKVPVVGAQQKGGQAMPLGNEVAKQEGAIPDTTLQARKRIKFIFSRMGHMRFHGRPLSYGETNVFNIVFDFCPHWLDSGAPVFPDESQ